MLSNALFSSTNMKLHLFTLFAVAACLTMTSCGGDDEGGQSESQVTDTNSNRNIVKSGETPSEVTRLEFPHLKDGNNIVLVHKTDDAYGVNYSLEWDYEKKSQRWSCYEMYNGYKGSAGRYGTFEEDPDLPTAMRFSDTNSMYKNSGFTRGHICPSADRQYSTEANHQTFYYTNVQPQYYNFNAGDNYGGIWVQMENRVRRWADSMGTTDTMYVCKGGTIDKEDQILTRVKGSLIVPKYFFMALLIKNAGGYKALAFWAEHTDTTVPNANLANYAISIDQLEELTGIDFFCNLPDQTEQEVESSLSLKAWAL